MASNKMLIDASHPEETRVVVVRGNRIEEFDFEAQERKQLRGNIYLAKVTRVEPSLQAAFVDYGGNRHGFLAFSEIHPDYYQIPAADRQALLAEEEAVAAEAEAQEEADALIDADDDGDGEEAPAPKRSRRRSRRSKAEKPAKGAAAEDADTETAEADAGEEPSGADASADIADSEAEEAEKPKKPKRKPRAAAKPRTRKTARKKSAGDAEDSADGSKADAEDGSKTIAAMMETDSVSEPAPPADDDAEDERSTDGAEHEGAGETDAEAASEPKKRKPRATRSRKKKAEDEAVSAGAESGENDDSEPEKEKPKRTRSRSKKAKEAEKDTEKPEEETAEAASSGEEAAEAPKKARRPRRRKKAREEAGDETTGKQAKPEDGDNGADQSDANGHEANGGVIESVGQDDALEEGRIKRPRRQYKIQEVVRRRQVMLVQVVKEERGNKGAALTTYLSLAGRYSVLMPNTARGGGISRKITNPADRKRLKSIAQALDVPKGMGVILRTAGASREQEEIQRDFDYLMRLWDNVRNLTLASTAPILVYEEGSLIKRSIRDLYNKDIGEIVVSGEAGYQEARDFMNMLMPSHEKNVKLYKGDQPILSRYSIESQLEKMVTPQVTLKSGGYLIINQTEALVAIDVNSGKSTREHSIEATALQTNLEAAEEIARQLRLRDLAGLIVIDFIDMEEKRNNRSVERKLKECLKSDRARIQVGHISHFGLLEMSRQRIRASVLESTMAVCPTCHGVGHVRSQSSLALLILRALEDHLNRNSRNDVSVKVSPSMAMYILNTKRRALSSMEQRFGLQIIIEADHDIGDQDYSFEKGDPATGEPGSAAVNMMHGSTPFDHDSEDEDNEDEDGRNKRGRRRRGRGRDKDRERDRDTGRETDREAGGDRNDAQSARDTSSDVSGEADDAANGNAASTEEPAAESASRRRTRRSKSADAGESQDGKKAAKADTPSADPQSEEDEADAEARRAKRRTGRPGKKAKVAAEESDTDTASEAVADDSPRETAPPRKVQRRNTRRVKKDGDEVADGEEAASGESQPGWSGFLS
ncbi:Rne/Rng family ribonuclease [Salaquimonas pukyongi]|uniref:Rne/Rng family ribonuclease n=1 Tax=Salaquimonas pukyongi TaxID=2712698 RepID=UPI00096BBF1A|nr:ribonuclease E/G [Salaquimonas pukyongi]